MKTIKHTKTVNYKESFIPKGCRKPRYQLVAHEVTFKVKQVEKEDTEVAFIIHDFEHEPREIRLYKGKLYAQQQHVIEAKENDGIRVRYVATQYKEGAVFHLCTRWDYSGSDTSDYNTPEDVEKLQRDLDDTLIIGNEVYVRCYQPYYSVRTFGIGSSWCFVAEIPTTSYENYELVGIAPDNMEALQKECDELNVSFSHEFGPKSLERALEYNRIEVVKPDALKMKFQSTESTYKVWEEKKLNDIVRADVMRFMEQEKKKLAKNFEYLSNYDFAYYSARVVDSVMDEIRHRKC